MVQCVCVYAVRPDCGNVQCVCGGTHRSQIPPATHLGRGEMAPKLYYVD